MSELNIKRASWSGQMAFILASAASAIGLGNLWRFPYLAAQYGGGTFIAVYLVLIVTLGFTLMLTEISIGRKTNQSALTAFPILHKKSGFIGKLCTFIPLAIVPYYCVIGGWVLKYFWTYLQMILNPGTTPLEKPSEFFTSFITANFAPFGFAMIFIAICALVVFLGVKNGIEKSNLVLMPLLLILAVGIAIFVICQPGAAKGVAYYLIPNLDSVSIAHTNEVTGEVTHHFSIALLGKTILGAMGQMFYSLSLAMGIMVTYGSYMRQQDHIEVSVRRIEIFDTVIAIIAGLMIVPAVYIFAESTGTPVKEAMKAGPGLMFMTLPKVFESFGSTTGPWIGLIFFLLVAFAALTSAISLYETCVASICDILHMKRNNATIFLFFVTAFLAAFSALGYGAWDKVTISTALHGLGLNGQWVDSAFCKMQFLDLSDFITNAALMPVTALSICILVGWVLGPKSIIDEVSRDGHPFKARVLYTVLVKYIAPIFISAVLISEICRNLGIGGWSI